MSTNYFAFGPFPGGEPDGEGLHIGQSAAGWTFLLRAHDDLGLISRAAWVEFLEVPGVVIRDEYGREVSTKELIETISARRGANGLFLRRRGFRSALDAHPHWADHCLVDAEGYELSRRAFC
ncbi:hypothetical protein ABZW44_22450 [Streptomyces mirabilis]|uniref:hypothetical protein n=1 Tax=Streptomyces mirabilis TaxID=68239 RepID=UPI0033B8D6DF